MKLWDKINKNLHDISPYKAGKPIEEVADELGFDVAFIMKMASNESAFGPSPKAMAALHRCIPDCFRYPDGSVRKLRQKIASLYGLSSDQVILGNGSNEILELVGHCLVTPDTSVIASEHSFLVYRIVARLFGAKLLEIPMSPGLVHDLPAMMQAIREDTAVIFICNPNNPTGTMVPHRELYQALENIPDNILVVVDEAYAEVTLDTLPSTLDFLKQKKNILICRTFSKGYGLAGLRLGYGLGAPEIISMLQRARQPFNVNRLAQDAGIAALDDQEFLENNRKYYREYRDTFQQACEMMRYPYIPTVTNFMLIDVDCGEKIAKELLRKGIIVRSMTEYGLPQYIRVTFGKKEENDRFLHELKSIYRRK